MKKPTGLNSRKGGLEGGIRRDIDDLTAQGLTPGEAGHVLSGDISGIMDDVVPTPQSNIDLDFDEIIDPKAIDPATLDFDF